MVERWRFDPHSYNVGDPIYVSYHRGWNAMGVTRYEVKRITPKGQITAANGTREIRLTARGDVMGQSGYRRDCVVSEAEAKELVAEQRRDDWWQSIRTVATGIETAARKQDADALAEAFNTLAAAIASPPPTPKAQG